MLVSRSSVMAREAVDMEGSQYQILIVDEFSDEESIIENFFSQYGYRVFHARRGEQAQQIIRDHEIDMVFIDMILPDMSGLTLLRRAKTIRPKTKYVMIAREADVETFLVCIKMGAYDYLLRPFPPYILKCMLERAMREADLSQTKTGDLNLLARRNSRFH